MKHPISLVIVAGMLLSSFAVAQTQSRVDVTGNLVFSGTQFVGAPISSGQSHAFGWQTSGIRHFNRWLSLTSQFGGGYASGGAIQLIGYNGPGSVYHYSSLLGPRIAIPSRSRFTPFLQGLGGIDYANTKFTTSNGTSVTGRELEGAYAFGGGTQINISRRIGLNVEANYFGTQHSVAFLGWTPGRLQLSAGIVIRMSGIRDQRRIAEEAPVSTPAAVPSVQPTTATAESHSREALTAAAVAVSLAQSHSFADTAKDTQTVQQQTPTQEPPAAPAAAVVKVEPVTVAAPIVTQPAIQTFQQQTVAQEHPAAPAAPVAKLEPVTTASVSVPPPAVRQAQSQPVTQQPASSVPVISNAPEIVPVAVAHVEPQQSAPLSLGEYARRLREKKQRQ